MSAPDGRSATSLVLVLVVAADPQLPILFALRTTLRRVIEDRVVRHDELQSTPRCRVRVVDLVAVADEGTEAWALGEVADGVGARRTGVVLDDRRERIHRARGQADLRDSLARLLFRLREAHVEVEVAGRGRSPRNAPAHPALVGLQLLERRL